MARARGECVVLIGSGGHAAVIADILESSGDLTIAGFTAPAGTQNDLFGYPCLGTDDALTGIFNSGVRLAFPAVGDNGVREKCSRLASRAGFTLVNAISRYAHVSSRARVGAGVAIMPGAVVNARAALGDGVIANTNSSIDHDCEIAEYTHVAPGAVLAGCVRVGRGAMLGAGCRVLPGVSIGEFTIVGAGAVVVRDLPARSVAVGVPARCIREIT